ncbi:hypothetical protein [Arthrobacter caoxuetaonis]|uniref:Uncharacterized protein n=1 Tax=Arthrobacter caoxuetaonis TaxID=2886935 RepID=A0A9X1SDN4_9MICC|nr:hypothetical protein [Arthrobacter caoxuetaonis]MCC3299353.1 hypothetical protein [Arthrobacter caoxuetaonis]USQ59154.1 hypothetical protein NF551_18785 [Arthrobacter caoxuetaonis]
MTTNQFPENLPAPDEFTRFLMEALAGHGLPADDRIRLAVGEARMRTREQEIERWIKAAHERSTADGSALIAALDERECSPTLDEYRAMEGADSNIFWRLDTGDHQNLLDEAMEQVDGLKEALRQVTGQDGSR